MNTRSGDQRMDSLKQLEDMSNHWFEFIEEFSKNKSSKFDVFRESIEQNIRLLDEIECKQQNEIKAIILKSNLSIDNKTTNELTETDLNNESIALESCLQSLSSELTDKKQHKTQLTNKTKALTKQLEEMEIKVRELKQEIKSNDSNEYLTLASVMRVMYKTWNNSKVIGLLFNDNEEKSLDRLIVIDRENKCEQQMAQQFWESLQNDYQIN